MALFFVNEESLSSVSVSVQRLLALRYSIAYGSQKSPPGRGAQAGVFISQRRGQGTEFDDLRPYQAGDDIRRVDWRASARTTTVYTRLYREEKDNPVLIITDLRDCMFTGSKRLRSVIACELSARLLWQAASGGCRVSLLCFGDRSHSFTESAAGSTAAIKGCSLLAHQFQAIQRRLSATQSTSDDVSTVAEDTAQYAGLPSGHPELTDALRWVLQQRRQGSAVIWATGMDSPGEHFEALLTALGNGQRQAFVHIDDPLLKEALPPGYYSYKTRVGKRHGKQSISIDRRVQKALRTSLQQTNQRREALFAKLKLPFFTCDDDGAEVLDSLRNFGYLP